MAKPWFISERWLIIGISVLMVLTLAMLARVLANTKERGERLGMLMLARALESQEERVKLITRTYTWDMEQQADRIRQEDTIDDAALLRRWLPLMRNRYAIRAIGLSDDQGNERVLQRAGSKWRFIKSDRSTDEPLTLMTLWPINGVEPPLPDTVPARTDPRGAIWFSHALENRKDGPVWSESEDPGETLILHLSMLIRGNSDNGAFGILHFDIAGDAMLADLNQWTPDIATVLLDSKWRSLSLIDTSTIGRVWTQVLNDRRADHSTNIFRTSLGDQRWVGRIIPVQLNGTRFHTGILIGFEGIERWIGEGRIGLLAVLGLLLLLGLMLALVFIQSRSAERRVLRQERRSHLQARNLAQAIGEREVLDREVHHRVKNNLQVVSSLLNLQAQRVPGAEARSEFMRGKRRIDSMALVHHKLYRQKDLSAVDLGVFLDDLAKALAAMFEPESRSVSHSVDAAGIRCDADTSIQLGMILCELLANCHQHAFPSTGGHISITVRTADDGSFILMVKDNGKGLDPRSVKDTHLGLEVVEALADQLDGTLRILNDGGTAVEVTFRTNRHGSGTIAR
ncbi:MAG: sensor histidine kinase [Flavobacteriales bacterium]|jgi:two-component sensor histidine kinase|nr:sensor histidine kinase [Flavobacteriales bacterium]